MNVKIYTTNACIYCKLAKKILTDKNIQFEEIDVEKNIKIFKEIIKETNYKTVPQIFINNKFIGGYEDLKIYFKI